MNPAMEEAMKLQASPDDAEVPISVPMANGEMMEVSPEVLAAEGMARSAQYMSGNGPVRPTHAGVKTMTKADYKKQVANEEQGYPSNTEEAEKVRALEGKVANIETGIGAILDRLGGPSSSVATPYEGADGSTPVYHVEPPEKESTPVSKPPSPSPTDSPESNVRSVKLRDGRKVNVPMSLGPATAAGDSPPEDPVLVDQKVVEVPPDHDDGWGGIIDAVETSEGAYKTQEDPRAVRISELVNSVYDFMKSGDCHRFWRRHLAGVHRHVGYNGWSKDLKMEFDQRFHGFLNDGSFVTNICSKIMDMEYGMALGAKWATSMVVATAGFTAFALSGLGD